MQVTEKEGNMLKITLDIKKPDGTKYKEVYLGRSPMLVIGNLIIGERYTEP